MSTIPDTTDFTLQDVVNLLNPGLQTLQGCFAAADPLLFDPAYEGNKDRLLNFRNYGGHEYLDPPSTPTGLSGEQVPTRRAKFTWNAASGASDYELIWNNGGAWFPPVITTLREWTSPEQNPDTTVVVQVRARNQAGNSNWASAGLYLP